MRDLRTVLVSHLSPDLENQDLIDIFSDVGEVLQVNRIYDASGAYSGACEVVFADAASARECLAEYDGAEVDGQPMLIRFPN